MIFFTLTHTPPRTLDWGLGGKMTGWLPIRDDFFHTHAHTDTHTGLGIKGKLGYKYSYSRRTQIFQSLFSHFAGSSDVLNIALMITMAFDSSIE